MSVKLTSFDYVQYGCGWESAPHGWTNYDASPTLRLERLPFVGRYIKKNKNRFPSNVNYGDIVKGLPIKDNSCKGVYCSHVIEHLTFEDAIISLKNSYKILADGGIFRLVLPDLERAIQCYVEHPNQNSAYKFMESTGLGVIHRPKNTSQILSALFGNSRHLWAWDYQALKEQLEIAGFSKVRRAYFGDSRDINFSLVEQEDRWLNSLGIECEK